MAMAKQFSGMIGQFGKMGLMNGGDKKLAAKLARDPVSLKRQLGKLPPQLLNTLGGTDGMMEMLSKMTAGGGLESMMGGGGGPASASDGDDPMAGLAGMMQGMMGGAAGPGGMPDIASMMKSMMGGGAGATAPKGMSKRAMKVVGRRR
jgi:hypothetical protein